MADLTDTAPVLLIVHASEVLRQLAERLVAVGALTLDDVVAVLPAFPQVEA